MEDLDSDQTEEYFSVEFRPLIKMNIYISFTECVCQKQNNYCVYSYKYKKFISVLLTVCLDCIPL